MKELREYLLNFIKLVKSKKFTIPLITIAVLSYAYRIANQTISRDDTALDFTITKVASWPRGALASLFYQKY